MGVLDRQWRRLNTRDVSAILDVVHAARRQQRLEIDILVGMTRSVRGTVDPRFQVLADAS